MKYEIYQITITKAQSDLINREGHNAVPAHVLQMDMGIAGFGNTDSIEDLAVEGIRNFYYTHVSNITANSLNEVFATGNIGPEENIERLASMHSISVGDIIKDEAGDSWVVAPCGFEFVGSRLRVAA